MGIGRTNAGSAGGSASLQFNTVQFKGPTVSSQQTYTFTSTVPDLVYIIMCIGGSQANADIELISGGEVLRESLHFYDGAREYDSIIVKATATSITCRRSTVTTNSAWFLM